MKVLVCYFASSDIVAWLRSLHSLIRIVNLRFLDKLGIVRFCHLGQAPVKLGEEPRSINNGSQLCASCACLAEMTKWSTYNIVDDEKALTSKLLHTLFRIPNLWTINIIVYSITQNLINHHARIIRSVACAVPILTKIPNP